MMLARQKWQVRTIRVLEGVFERRLAQHARYGDNADLDDGTGEDTAWLQPYTYSGAAAIEESLRKDYDDFEEEVGKPTWLHLVREEVAEAFMESDPAKLEDELLDVAALCVSWVEQIRARAGVAKPADGE